MKTLPDIGGGVSLILALILALSLTAQAKEWRGIMPLQSTRVDVERLLGPPIDDPSNKGIYIRTYRTKKEEIVSVLYSDTTPCNGYLLRGYRVPEWTVISIIVQAAPFPLSDLKLDSSKYKETSGGDTPDFSYFTDEEEGVSYEVQSRVKDADDKYGRRLRFVTGVTYGPRATDKHLLCPKPPAPNNGTHPTPNQQPSYLSRQ